jgi:hypothetical protein
MQSETKIYGIAFHSPLDISTFLPLRAVVSIDVSACCDFLFAEIAPVKSKAKICLVFQSYNELRKNQLDVLDVVDNSIVHLTPEVFEGLLEKFEKESKAEKKMEELSLSEKEAPKAPRKRGRPRKVSQ